MIAAVRVKLPGARCESRKSSARVADMSTWMNV